MKPWWLRLARYALPHGGGLSLVILLMLVGVAFDALKPWPLKLLVDCVLASRPFPAAAAWIADLPFAASPTALMGWLAGGTILLFVAGRAIGIMRGYLEAGVASRMAYDLGADLFDHLQRLSLRFHGRQLAGDLVRRVTTDTRCVGDLMLWVFVPMVTSLTSLATMFAVMWRLDRALSLLALLAALPLAALIRLLAGPMAARTYRQEQLEGEVMALVEQTLSALPVVQAFGREEYGDGRFRGLSGRTVQACLRVIVSQLQFKVATSAVMAIGAAAIMVIGGLHVLAGSLSVGSLLVFLAYLASAYDPLETLAYVSAGFASAGASARRVLAVLDTDEGVRDLPAARPLPALPAGRRGHVRLEGVTFGYEAGHPVLRHVTLEARPGETVALVGATGAGKSTLVSLIPRFFDPWEGRVTLDGVDVREVRLASLRAQVALVLQEPFLLPLTVAENIAYGRTGASPADIVAAAAAANADGFIRRLPKGYDTVIGERGATLSGGERQRLAIARAVLKGAPVLILDEPTSALDAETEASVLEALERLMNGRTTLVIGHRLSTVRRADRIVALAGGRIAEAGTHQGLLASGGLYRRLHDSQFGPASTRVGAREARS